MKSTKKIIEILTNFVKQNPNNLTASGLLNRIKNNSNCRDYVKYEIANALDYNEWSNINAPKWSKELTPIIEEIKR